MPGDTPVAMDVLVGVGSGASARKSLHVQSVSCWAPACIGPYAQAVTHLGLTHMAGVIGMVPATLDMIRSDVDVDGDVDANATEARRAWRSAAAAFTTSSSSANSGLSGELIAKKSVAPTSITAKMAVNGIMSVKITETIRTREAVRGKDRR